MNKTIIYTDGACKTSNNYGGWSFLIVNNPIIVKLGRLPNTTNNVMELMAIYKALQYCYNNNLNDITIYSDSMYCIGTLSLNWKRSSNIVLLKNIDKYLNLLTVNFIHVKGHTGNTFNEIVDFYSNTELYENNSRVSK